MAVNVRTDPNSATTSNLQALQAVLLRVGDFWRDMIQNLHPDSQHPRGSSGGRTFLKYTTAYWPGGIWSDSDRERSTWLSRLGCARENDGANLRSGLRPTCLNGMSTLLMNSATVEADIRIGQDSGRLLRVFRG